MNESGLDRTDYPQLSLLYIQANEQATGTFQRAALRVRRHIRAGDELLLLNNECAIVLPATDLAGAEAVARRLTALLSDLTYESRVVAGNAALDLRQRLYDRHARQIEHVPCEPGEPVSSPSDDEGKQPSPPYLAFLANFPPARLLNLFPYELSVRYQCVPIGAERGILTLATSQPLTQAAIAHLQSVTQRSIFQVRCEPLMVQEILAFNQQYLTPNSLLIDQD